MLDDLCRDIGLWPFGLEAGYIFNKTQLDLFLGKDVLRGFPESKCETETLYKGLVTNYGEGGGATKWDRGGGTKSRKGFSHAEGGAQKVVGCFLSGSLKF